MAEIERDEEEELAPPALPIGSKGTEKGKDKEGGAGETTTPPGSPRPAKRKREPNPNAEALRDVAKFTLADDPAPGQGRRKVPERYYYTKPRSVYSTRLSKILMSDLDCNISWIQCRSSTKCTFIRWVLGLMRMRSVKLLTLVVRSLEIES